MLPRGKKYIYSVEKRIPILPHEFRGLVTQTMNFERERLPYTSRFFVVALQGQIGLNFVGPSACRTPADFLSRLTALRLGAESSKIKMVPIPLTRRKLKLALFTSTFLRRIMRRRKSSTRTT